MLLRGACLLLQLRQVLLLLALLPLQLMLQPLLK